MDLLVLPSPEAKTNTSMINTDALFTFKVAPNVVPIEKRMIMLV
jgi:hypothetical protein